MACRFAGLCATRAARGSGSATTRTLAGGVGGKRHLTLTLLVGRIHAPDVLRRAATPSAAALNALDEAERKLLRDHNDSAEVARLRDQMLELPQSEAWQFLRRGLESASPAHRWVWLRRCLELLKFEATQTYSTIDEYILPQVQSLLRDRQFPDVQLEAVRVMTALAHLGRSEAIICSGAVAELCCLSTSGDSKNLRQEANLAVHSVWQRV